MNPELVAEVALWVSTGCYAVACVAYCSVGMWANAGVFVGYTWANVFLIALGKR